jgi:hypothetical protein
MNQYSSAPFEPEFLKQGSFRPEFPMMNDAFLFARIAEKVVRADIVREEEDERVVVVEYEPLAQQIFDCSAVTYRVDRRTNLIARMEGVVTHQFPEQEIHSSRNSVVYSHLAIDQEIPAATFQYAPPADAIDASEGRGVGFGRGSGFARRSSDGKKDSEEWHSSWWDGEAWLEQRELRIRGVELKFERRLSFEGGDLRIAETITGPLGITEREFSIEVQKNTG